jgi:hypothetical protein
MTNPATKAITRFDALMTSVPLAIGVNIEQERRERLTERTQFLRGTEVNPRFGR